jgi:hypothetical protein
VMSAPCAGLVQANGGDRGEILLGAGARDVVILGASQAHVADVEQLCHLADGHRVAQGHDHCLHQLGEAAGGAHPGHRDLGRVGPGLAAHPRYLGVDVLLELEAVQMAPLALLGALRRLTLSPAAGIGEAPLGVKATWKSMRPAGRPKATSATLQGAGRPRATVNNEVGCMVIRPARLPVDEPYGRCGQPMDRAARRRCDQRAPSRRGLQVDHTLGPLAHKVHTHNNGFDNVCSQTPLRWGCRWWGKPGYPHQM